MRKNIFVVGLEPFNLGLLKKVLHAENYAFHGLLSFDAVAKDPNADVDALLKRAFARMDAFPGRIDAIVGYWDFPTILMLPILRRSRGLPGPSLESVLRCEHKYWARTVQNEVRPDLVPPFARVDPFDDHAAAEPPLPFPFWIKPVKAHSSILGFRIRNRPDYRRAIAAIRRGIGPLAVNLDKIMAHADLPDALARGKRFTCIAEGLISAGRQCTLEGYVAGGEPEVYGIVDSVRGRNRSSFERYQYPSALPRRVQRRMIDAARDVIGATGLDQSPFNMEFFWDRQADAIFALEINARISKSHSPLFEKVEGVPHNEVMIDCALGRRPEYPLRRGRHRRAAKFMLRRYGLSDEARVVKAPDDAARRAIEARHPGCEIIVHVAPGMRLGDMPFQDSYSHELADVFVGADTQDGLSCEYNAIVEELDIRIEEAS